MIKENYRLTLSKRLTGIKQVTTPTVRNILEVCGQDPDLCLVGRVLRIVANTGLMNCELSALQVADVDVNQRQIVVGTVRASRYAKRSLPLQPKTLSSVLSLIQMHPDSAFVLGDAPQYQLSGVIDVLRRRFPEIAHGRLFMYSIRMNFVQRLFSASVPLSVTKYWLGNHDLSRVMPSLPLTNDQKLEIVRRSIGNFMVEL